MTVARVRRVSLLLIVVNLGCFCGTMAQDNLHSFSGYTPHRVFAAKERRFSDFEAMLAELSRSDIVLVGEQHDDPNTHRLERAILEGLARRRSSIVLALEMFERDVQPLLDEYLAGRISEETFLKASRPWPRYATDYRPLLEFARAHSYPVVAGNVPRRYASQVARAGLSAVESLPADERALIARDIKCPTDDYFKRFSETMKSHPASQTGTAAPASTAISRANEAERRATVERLYLAQCIKDETMAESLARLFPAERRGNDSQASPLAIHFNGAFHSDFRLGTASRVQDRLPRAAIKTVTIVPVADLDNFDPDSHRKRADFVIFTLKPIRTNVDSPERKP